MNQLKSMVHERKIYMSELNAVSFELGLTPCFMLHSSPDSTSNKMSIEEKFTQTLTEHYTSNKKGLIPKREYHKIIDDLKAAAVNPHNKGRLG